MRIGTDPVEVRVIARGGRWWLEGDLTRTALDAQTGHRPGALHTPRY